MRGRRFVNAGGAALAGLGAPWRLRAKRLILAAWSFNRIDPSPPRFRSRRFKPIPVRTLLPNLITLLALCAGLTAIRLAFEDRLELALAAIVFAALLDGIDGRVARMLKGTSRFGAELDSLADFVNFGVRAGADPLLLGPARTRQSSAGSPRWCSRSARRCGSRAST